MVILESHLHDINREEVIKIRVKHPNPRIVYTTTTHSLHEISNIID